MKRISKAIVEDSISEIDKFKVRNTVRAVVLNEKNEVYMLYSKLYDDYTFPGGGIKDDETHIEALKREIKEEVGAQTLKVIEPLGFVEEFRYGINSTNNIYKQISYYYICEFENIKTPKYIGREKNQGLEMRWVKIDDAIKYNELINKKRDTLENKGFKTVLIRENNVLKYIKDEYL